MTSNLETRGSMAKGVTIKGKYTLRGTLSLPKEEKERYPAVLIVAGTGRIDRDGNTPDLKFELNLYKDLARLLNSWGFAVLRYDKRGVGSSLGNFLETGMWDLVEDAGACVSFLKEHSSVDPGKVVLLGHSEGCLLSTACAARNSVAGLVLLAGAAETLEEALSRQRRIIFAELMKQKGIRGWLYRFLKIDKRGEKQAQKLLEKVRKSEKDVIRANFSKINARWMREHLEYNVREDMPAVTCPVLAATGSKDIQSDPERLKELPGLVTGEVTWRVIENMNHPLKEASEDIALTDIKGMYRDSAKKPVHPELVELLRHWLQAKFIS